MNVRSLHVLLAALALALVWTVPAGAETAAGALCAQAALPTAEIALGAPDWQPQQTCGPCLLHFCGAVGVRCDYTGCGPNCCAYSCSCDLSCTDFISPSYACRYLIPSGCLCGNGAIDPGEQCDDPDYGGATCVTLGYDGGTLGCTGGCLFDTSECFIIECGDDLCQAPEDCDTCPADCDSKTTGNPNERFCCGNGIAEPAEGIGCSVCDGNC